MTCAPIGREGPNVPSVEAILKELGGKDRPAQNDLLADVARNMADNGHRGWQAPTGTGKSFAYLVAAVHAAIARRERTVVSTHAKKLQDQVVDLDVPRLRAALRGLEVDRELDVQVYKGTRNYVCAMALRETEDKIESGLLGGPAGPLALSAEAARAAMDNEDHRGDQASIGLADADWKHFNTTSDDCLGKACPFADACKSRKARAKASEADIVVTNHAMLAIQALNTDAPIINEAGVGPFDHIVADEAHELPSSIRSMSDKSTSLRRLADLMADVSKLMSRIEPLAVSATQRSFDTGRWSRLLGEAASEIAASSNFGGVGTKNKPKGLVLGQMSGSGKSLSVQDATIASLVLELDRAQGDLSHVVNIDYENPNYAWRRVSAEDRFKAKRLRSRVSSAGLILRRFTSTPPVDAAKTVAWMRTQDKESANDEMIREWSHFARHGRQGGPPAEPRWGLLPRPGKEGTISPADSHAYLIEFCARRFVTDDVASQLFEGGDSGRRPSVSLVSATLPSLYLRELGIDQDARVLKNEAFGPARQRSLFLTVSGATEYLQRRITNPDELRKLTDPTTVCAEFLADVMPGISRTVTPSGSLVLCPSNKTVERVSAAVAASAPSVPLFPRHGQNNDAAQVEWLHAGGLLVGSKGMMTGVDAPGTKCVVVVIERPAHAPRNPVDDARNKAAQHKAKEIGAAHEYVYHVDAAVLLEQSVGRLIRSEEDFGVVIVADERIAETAYDPRHPYGRVVAHSGISMPEDPVDAEDLVSEVARYFGQRSYASPPPGALLRTENRAQESSTVRLVPPTDAVEVWIHGTTKSWAWATSGMSESDLCPSQSPAEAAYRAASRVFDILPGRAFRFITNQSPLDAAHLFSKAPRRPIEVFKREFADRCRETGSIVVPANSPSLDSTTNDARFADLVQLMKAAPVPVAALPEGVESAPASRDTGAPQTAPGCPKHGSSRTDTDCDDCWDITWLRHQSDDDSDDASAAA